MNNKNITAISYALAAALFYAINVPCSKLLLEEVSPTFMAAFLYLGAGIGVGAMYVFHYKNERYRNMANHTFCIALLVVCL